MLQQTKRVELDNNLNPVLSSPVSRFTIKFYFLCYFPCFDSRLSFGEPTMSSILHSHRLNYQKKKMEENFKGLQTGEGILNEEHTPKQTSSSLQNLPI